MTSLALALRSFGVAFGDRVILSGLDLDVFSPGMMVLVGPAGCGKSTLLRTLAGLNDAHPSLTTNGNVSIAGQLIPSSGGRHAPGETRRPALVMQDARFFLDTVRENLVSALPNRWAYDRRTQTELVTHALRASGLADLAEQLDRDAVTLPLWQQRGLAIVRALVAQPPVLLADEPTTGLDESEAVEVITTLRLEAQRRAVVYVTHNQRLARAAGGTTVLLAGGRVQEVAPTRDFFSNPRTDAGRQFVATGGCALPGPSAQVNELPEHTQASRVSSLAHRLRTRSTKAPHGFYWIRTGRLGGLPRPGIIDSLDDDLTGLERLGVTVLVTLEETQTVPAGALLARHIRSAHFPVPDMGVPDVLHGIELCARVDAWLKEGDVVALHCRAGLGRTGTLLACQLIWWGDTARSALDSVRSIHARCIQSDEQVTFLRSFETAARSRQTVGRQEAHDIET